MIDWLMTWSNTKLTVAGLVIMMFGTFVVTYATFLSLSPHSVGTDSGGLIGGSGLFIIGLIVFAIFRKRLPKNIVTAAIACFTTFLIAIVVFMLTGPQGNAMMITKSWMLG